MGLWVGVSGIEASFYIFAAGVTVFAILALFTRFPPISASQRPGDRPTTTADESNEPEDEERRRLLASKRQNIIPPNYDPHNYQSTASSFFTALSNARSVSSMNDGTNYVEEGLPRHDSFASYANTEFLDEHDDLIRTATSFAAQDVQMEASQRIANLDHLPSLGLALSQIPTLDTSLAVFADLGKPETRPPQKSTLRQPRVWSFLITTMLYGISYSMISQLLFLFFRNHLGMESSLMGWTGPIGGIAEVSTFWLSNKVNFSIC